VPEAHIRELATLSPKSDQLFDNRRLREKKVGRFVRQPTQIAMCLELSAHGGDALLGICLGRARWLRRQLKHRCLLTLT
jgi:hypothetical protein